VEARDLAAVSQPRPVESMASELSALRGVNTGTEPGLTVKCEVGLSRRLSGS